MYEINLSIDNAKADTLARLQERLAPYVSRADGVMVLAESVGRPTLTLACEEDKKAVLTCGITESVADIIVNKFKSEYLIENSKLPINNTVNYNAFLKALVAFDREFDRELVLKKLFLSKDLMLDGFYNFRLRELRARWQEVVALANDNSGYVTFQETFLELLKFIVNTINESIDEIHVRKKDGGYYLSSADGSEINYRAFNINPEINNETLLSELIVLSPSKIYIHCADEIPKYVYDMLSGVFDKKLAAFS